MNYCATILVFLLMALWPTSPAWTSDQSTTTADSTSNDNPPEAGEASDEVVQDEIIVTGKLIEDSLQQTPESVAVWRSDFITDAGMGELQDIFNQTANAYQVANGEGFGIRGINHGGVGTGGTGDLGSYYTDGVAMTGFAKRVGPMQLWDVEQVEILRGPQTTNVGRNAMAGTVIVNTKDPVLYNESRWRFGLAQESTWDVAGMVNVPLNDRSALRLTAETWRTEGFVTNPTRGENDADSRENLTLRTKYLYQPKDDISVVVSALYGETRRGQDLVDLSRPDDRINNSNLDGTEENDSLMLSADVVWSLNDRWGLRSITSFLDSDYVRRDDDDQGPGGGDSFRARNTKDRNWAQDLRLEYGGERGQGVFGLFYTEVDIDGVTFGQNSLDPAVVGVPAILLPFYPETFIVGLNTPFLIETSNFAAFTRWDWNISDRLSIFAGLRWDLEQQTSDQTTSTSLLNELPDTAGLPPVIAGAITAVNNVLLSQIGTTNVQTDTEYDALLPEFGFSYQLNDSLVSSLFIKRGYRAGGAELSLTGRQNEFDPETLDLVELSLKAVTLGSRLSINSNLYYGDWTDQQVSVQQSANFFDVLTENAGESEIYGFETDFTYRPQGAWDLYGSIGFAHTEFTEFSSPTQGDFSGNRFISAPEWTAALGFNYRFLNGWFAHADVSYQSSAFSSVNNSPDLRLDARTLVNLRLGYETGKYSILGFLENAGDEIYAVTAFRGVHGRKLGKVGNPRQAGIQLILRF